MHPEHAVGLELILVEPLVGGRLVGKLGMCRVVVADIDRFVTAQDGFHVVERAVLAPVAIDLPVVNRADGEVAYVLALGGVHRRLQREVDVDAEVDADLADSVAEILELVLGIAPGVDDDETDAWRKF